MLETVLINSREELFDIVNKFKLEITERLVYQYSFPFIGILYTNEGNTILKEIDPAIIGEYNNICSDNWK